MNLVLHIGSPKTGSTSIQNFLKKNYNILKNNGFLYETSSINHQSVLEKAFKDENFLINWANDLKHLAKTNKNHTIIISSESLFNQSKENIKKLIEAFGLYTKVIVYLKRQDLYMESIWKQWHFKNKHYKDFYSFLNKYQIENYWDILKRYEEIVSKNNINIIPFEKKNIGKEGLLKNFISYIIKDEKLKNMLKYKIEDTLLFEGNNIGLSPKALNIAFLCRDLAKGPLDYTIEKFFDKYFKDLFKKNFFDSYCLFKNKEDRLNFINRFTEINQKIARYYLNKNSLFEEEIIDDCNKEDVKITNEDIVKMLVYLGIKLDKAINNNE